MYQWFRWNAANLLYFKACRGNLTIEPDAVFDKSDGLTYLGQKIGAKLSNLPRRYDDTGIDDLGNEKSYTIGSGDAQQLIAETKYFTLIRTKAGKRERGPHVPTIPEWCASPPELLLDLVHL